jgi:hypothetical protein
MTSKVSRQDVLDELYKLGGKYKVPQITRVMLTIDRYATTVAVRMQDNQLPDTPEVDTNLKPGETDINRGMRCCAECGKVRNLHGFFAKDRKAPYGRKQRCIICRPLAGRSRADRYLCRKCNTRKPLSHFPDTKREKPSRMVNCLECGPLVKQLPAIPC